MINNFDLFDIFSYLKDNIVQDYDSIPSHIHQQCQNIVNSLKHHNYLIISNYNNVISNINNNSSNEILNTLQSFFNQPLDLKQSCYSKDRARRGYCDTNSENYSTLLNKQIKSNDIVEKYRIGPIINDTSINYDYYNHKDAKMHYYNNTWSNIPNFQMNLTNYYNNIIQISILLLQIIEIGISLSKGILVNQFDKHTSILSINYYKSIENIDDNLIGPDRLLTNQVIRVAEHTDVSMLTIVSQLSNSNHNDLQSTQLQVYVNNNWISIPYSNDDLIVHVGDLLEFWSNGMFKSVKHRVITSYSDSISKDRYSLAYFLSPNYDITLDDVFQSTENNNQIISMTYNQWRKERIKRAMNK